MGLGCAMVAPLDEEQKNLPSVGRRCNLFDYTSKVIISLNDYEKMKAIEIRRVRTCSPNSTKWITKIREPGMIYANESVDRLKKCGTQSKKKLVTVGINTVRDLKNVPNPNDFVLPKGLPRKTFVVVWHHAQDASDDYTPPPIDHRKDNNPYISKYGDEWEREIKKSVTFSTSVIITDYVEHIMKESERVMKDTKHSEDWMVYHDALTLMTAKENNEWMRQKGYLKRWILPTDDLYVNLPELKSKYNNNPIGNSPEFMPWDAHLNSDVHASMDYHCLVSKELDDDDPRKFDASTPKKMLEGYKRILDPGILGISPPSKRIIQDVSRTILAFKMVRAAEGCLIDEKQMRTGRRHETNNVRSANWGDKRTKKHHTEYVPPSDELHNDLLEVREAQIVAVGV